ncbi:helix-turn-helix domain-containing protein [Alicyclobacillus fastidiosus]|uniref:helix-turn-helix domain-containing protein n=1 Tax=Alicyclobacillus fastidiosus TaxID=392011 RepID=UPI0034D3C0FE
MLSVDGVLLPLTGTQTRILERLAREIRHPVTHRELIRYAWGHPDAVSNQALYVYINRIRSKWSGQNGHLTNYVISIHGYGYMLYPKI